MQIKILSLIAIICLTEGCTNDSDEPTPASTKKNCYLLKSTSTNSLNDLLEEKTYQLNSEGKVIELTTILKSNSTSFSYSEKFEYAQNGKISKVEGTNYYHTYTYNTSNQLTNISYFVDNIITSKIDIQYNSSGQLIKKIYSESISGTLVYIGYRDYSYSDNTSINAIKESFKNTGNVLQFYIQYEYDEKANPFSNIGLDHSLSVPAVNNISKSTYTQITGSPSATVTSFTYKYNDSGYPSQLVKSSSGNETINFVYDCK